MTLLNYMKKVSPFPKNIEKALKEAEAKVEKIIESK